MTAPRIVRGQLLAFFAFDVGYEVSLDKIPTLCAASPIQPLSRKRQTPAYLQFAKPPVTLNLKTSERLFGSEATLQATVFDFGAVSLAYRWSLPSKPGMTLDQLAQTGIEVYGRDMEGLARQDIVSLLDRIEPAINRPKMSPLTEDYYLYIIEELEPALTAAE